MILRNEVRQRRRREQGFLGDVCSAHEARSERSGSVSQIGRLEARRGRGEIQQPAREHAVVLAKIAKIQFELGYKDTAISKLEDAAKVFDEINDKRSMAVTRGLIADIYESNGMLEQSLEIREKEELPFAESAGDFISIAICNGKIAAIYEQKKEYEIAIFIRRTKEIPVYEKYPNSRLLVVGRVNLAIALFFRGRDEDRTEVKLLLQQSLTDAERLRLTEAQKIREWIIDIFGPDISSPTP
jgi:tetratricopeptide (TPR) repeat protein